MRRALLAAAAMLSLSAPAPAAADLNWSPCNERLVDPFLREFTYECATLVVPLDRSGRVPGIAGLRIAREGTDVTAAATPLVVVGGVPGAASVRYASIVSHALRGGGFGKVLRRAPLRPPPSPRVPYRIVTMDIRGTGSSGALSCPSLQPLGVSDVTVPPPGTVEACAQRLGPARDAYSTNEAVEDLEALRVALGVEKLTLVGSSYGTYVVLRYAQAHPDRVERMLLDSVVPRTSVGTAYLSAYPAIRQALRRLCTAGRCQGVTTDPVQDLAQTLQRVQRKRLVARLFNASGVGVTRTIGDEADVFDIVREGLWVDDLRADLVAALAAAARGDAAPLVRLADHGRRGYILSRRVYSQGAHVAVLCNDLAGTATAVVAAAALVAPFPPSIVDRNGLAETCKRWPATTAPPAPEPTALPAIPTLMLSGGYDVVSPPALARGEAALIPGAQRIVVPAAAHAPVLQGANDCARVAAARFLARRPLLRPCQAQAYLPNRHAYPARLDAVRPLPGFPEAAGRAIAVALRTLDDAQAGTFLRNRTRGAGLRGGVVERRSTGAVTDVRLRGAILVPGIRVTGRYSRAVPWQQPERHTAVFTLTGPGLQAHFTLAEDRTVVGEIDGKEFEGRLRGQDLRRI